MANIVAVLYLRVHNVGAVRQALGDSAGEEFLAELGGVLRDAVTSHGGIVSRQRIDWVLGAFASEADAVPDHATRAVHAAAVAVYGVEKLSAEIAQQPGMESLPRLALTAGVQLGEVEVSAPRRAEGLDVAGETVEIARVLETTAQDLRWSIATSARTRRAAGRHVESGRIGSLVLPDGAFVEIVEVTGVGALKYSRSVPENDPALRSAIAANRRLLERPQDIVGAGIHAAQNAALHFSIDGYRIQRKVGEGGMAQVYLADPGGNAEPQVLKVMPITGSAQSDALQRFLQEFALLAELKHPNIVAIHRQGFSAGHAYIAMEYFPLGDLRARIASGVDLGTALSYARQIASALGAIHSAGIVHRDLKPDNLMLRRDGTLALTDFGIAKHVSMMMTETAHDEVLGTPFYLSPEQALAAGVDARSDLYSLGVIVYEMLTGTKPYNAQTAEELLDLHINAPVPQLGPRFHALQPLLDRLMAKDRDARYPDAAGFLSDLRALGA